MDKADGTIMIKDARIIFRNFEGKEGPFNRKGDRNFAVILTDEFASELAADGWNVKMLKARDEGDPETPYLQVAVSFTNRPPRITMITSTSRTSMTEETVEILDGVDILKADLVIRPYQWNVQDKSGIKAYLKTLFITIEEDELEREYALQEMDED